MKKFIPVNIPLLDGNEKKYLIDCIDSGWISSEGPFVEKFEQQFAKFVGRKYAVAVSNGSVAIDCAIEALKIKKGDEIIMPTFTIISCVSQILRNGAKPIFVDSDIEHFNMNVNEIEQRITKKTRAIMVVHIYGIPVDINPILELARKYNLQVIEDAAEVHGQKYYNKQCGSFGDISIFSFYPNKHITTGEGGMILTDDINLYNRCKELRNLCFKPERRFLHDNLGWNFRMTNFQAAIGCAQLERIDHFINLKRKMGEFYLDVLSDYSDYLQLPVRETEYSKNIFWVFSIVLKEKLAVKTNANKIISLLADNGIGSRPFFYPLHKQPIVNQFCEGLSSLSLLNSEFISENGFYLPSGLGNTEDDFLESAEQLIKIIKKIW
jgi:perosamine synthetase